MTTHLEMLRFYVAELLIYYAFRLLPPGREQRDMAIFLQHSWIGRMVDPDALAREQLQREWKRKLESR